MADTSAMNLEASRVESFKNWPYEDDGQHNICTAKRMAEAGFYSCANEACPDLVRCYVCYKELEGWEPNDDPWAEHLSHSIDCAFAKKGRPQAQLTVEEFMKMEMASQQNRLDKELQSKIEDVEKVSAHVQEQLWKLSSC